MKFLDRLNNLGQKKQQSVLSASLVLGITFAISAILGFLRSRFLYAEFFKCCVAQLDVYNAAFRIPDLIFKLLVTGALSASFIPVFSSYLHKDQNKAYQIASSVISILSIIFIIASIIVLIFTRSLTQLIAAGFTPEQLDLMVNLTRILLIAQVFFLISNFLTAILQVNQVFIIPSLSPIIYNLSIIISIFVLAPIFGIYGVVYGAVIGAFFHLLIQIPAVKNSGFKYSFNINYHLSGVKEVFRLMAPRSLSLGLGEIENTVTLFFASSLPIGSLSLLNLAMQLMYLPSRIFGTTVGQASLPILSKNIAKNELEDFRQTVSNILLQSLFVALPITVLIVVERLPIVRLLFGSQNFPWSATLTTARILAFLTPAIICQSIIQILIRSFYALHNTKTPFKVSCLSLITNITTSFILINFTNLGIIGLAISSTATNIIQMSGLFYFFIKSVNGFDWIKTLRKLNKMLFASLFMGLSSWLSLKFLDLFIFDTTRTIALSIVFSASSLIGIIVYVFMTDFLGIDEINDYKKYLAKFKRFVFRK